MSPPMAPMGQEMSPLAAMSSPIKDGYDETNEARLALCKKWAEKVKNAKKFFGKNFKQMNKDMEFISGHQWDTKANSEANYTANITQRQIGSKVAALYAKNPTVIVSRRDKLDFQVWDESKASLMQLMSTMQGAQNGMVPPGPQGEQIIMQAQALYQDVTQGVMERKQLDKIAKTMEILFKYTLTRQTPNFKLGMKQLVRRVCVTSVGYIKLGYQRMFEKRPIDVDKVTDITQRIESIQRLINNCKECGGDCTSMEADCERLRLELQASQENPEQIVEDGVVFDFPRSTSIIVDPKCVNLRTFWGAQWVAQEYILSKEDIEEIYKVKIGEKFMEYNPVNSPRNGEANSFEKSDDRKNDAKVLVWEIYVKTEGLVYVVCDGYPDFLKEPAEPEIKIRRFWPFFPLLFNEVENDNEIYPQSDVSLIRPMQQEYNRAREGLREHRHANRPKMVFGAGALSPEDIEKFRDHPANACIALTNLAPGQKVTDLIQVLEGPAINPTMYETDTAFQDILHVAGAQEANLGGTGDTTATESSIAETSRISSLQSNIDDLDDTFNELVNSTGELMLQEMDIQTVQKICGKGAVWPQLTGQEIADQLNFQIEAGSSGRPNKALEVANFQKIAPILLQIPGISPDWMAKQSIQRLDDKLDVTDALTDSMQSIVAMNSMQQVSTGNPASDPNQQGHNGGKPPIMGGRPMNPNAPPPEAPNGVPGPGQPPHPTPSSVPQLPSSH